MRFPGSPPRSRYSETVMSDPNQAPLTLLILAAGIGSRYGGLKQIDPIGPHGETLLDYSVYDALRAGFTRVVLILRKAIEAPFREAIGERLERHLPVDYVFQELDSLPAGFFAPEGRTRPWGTTHAVLAAADVIREPFAVINADDFYGAESYQLLAQQLRASSPEYALIGFPLATTLSEFGSVARAICKIGPDGYLQSAEEMTQIQREIGVIRNIDSTGKSTQLTGKELVSMNQWGFQPGIFPLLEARFRQFLESNPDPLQAECYLPGAINSLVATAQVRVRVLPATGSWFGVTYREDRPRIIQCIRHLIVSGTYPEELWP